MTVLNTANAIKLGSQNVARAYLGTSLLFGGVVQKTTYVRDTFTSASAVGITTRPADTGQAWALAGGVASNMTVTNGFLRGAANAAAIVDWTATNDYTVSADAYWYSATTGQTGITARASGTTTFTFYTLALHSTNGLVFRRHAGNNVPAVTYKSAALGTMTAGQVTQLELTVKGSTITAHVNGAVWHTITDTTLATGRAGVFVNGASPAVAPQTGVLLDNFLVTS